MKLTEKLLSGFNESNETKKLAKLQHDTLITAKSTFENMINKLKQVELDDDQVRSMYGKGTALHDEKEYFKKYLTSKLEKDIKKIIDSL